MGVHVICYNGVSYCLRISTLHGMCPAFGSRGAAGYVLMQAVDSINQSMPSWCFMDMYETWACDSGHRPYAQSLY